MKGNSMAFKDLLSNKKLPVGELPSLPDFFMKTPHPPKIITFWSSKGGTGKTTVALNTCAYLATEGKRRIVLIDIDEFGDTGLSSGLEEKYKGHPPRPEDLLPNLTTIKTFEDVEPFLIKEDRTGMYLLSSPKTFERDFKMSVEGYKKIVTLLANFFNIIAFDCGDRLYDDYTRFALLNSNVIIVVADQGKPTLANLSEVLEEFANPSSGIGKDKMVMIVNKFREKVGMPITKISEWFGKAVSCILPITALDKDFLKTLNQGDIFLLKTSSMEIKNQYKDLAIKILEKFYQ